MDNLELAIWQFWTVPERPGVIGVSWTAKITAIKHILHPGFTLH